MGASARVALCAAAALLCALGRGRSCGQGRALRGTGTDERCCRSGGAAQDAAEADDCTCLQPEFHCADPQCGACRHHPCPPGQRARAHGRFAFDFDCVDCEPGTFSPGREGRCRPWADCSQFGFATVFPGNRTHNVACSPGPPPALPAGPLGLALLATAACILVLTAVQLGLLLWQLGRPRARSPGPRGPGPVGAASACAPEGGGPAEEAQPLWGPPLPAEDTCSCQLPEEERGEPQPEDKGRRGDLWA